MLIFGKQSSDLLLYRVYFYNFPLEQNSHIILQNLEKFLDKFSLSRNPTVSL